MAKTGVAAGAGPGGLRVARTLGAWYPPEDRGFGVGVTCPAVQDKAIMHRGEGAGSPGKGSGGSDG